MFIFPTKIFNIDYQKVGQSTIVNKDFLIRSTIFGLVLNLSSRFFPGELGFIAYLFSMVRFVGAFALLSIDRKLWYWSALVILLELTLMCTTAIFMTVSISLRREQLSCIHPFSMLYVVTVTLWI